MRFFEAISVNPYGDALGEDAPSVAGATTRFRGVVSSLKTEGAMEARSILTPTDLRARLGSPPDEAIFIREVSRSGAGVEPWQNLVDSPNPAAELAMQRGIGLTVIHTSLGAA